jgi:SNF2 family DNA or RNA helicase
LQEKLNDFAFRVTKEECLDLPDKIYTRRDVELTKEQQTYYDQMKLMALAVIDGI